MQDLGRMCRYATRANGFDYDDLPYALIGKKLAEILLVKISKQKNKVEFFQTHSNFQGCFLEKGGNFLDHYCKADKELQSKILIFFKTTYTFKAIYSFDYVVKTVTFHFRRSAT